MSRNIFRKIGVMAIVAFLPVVLMGGGVVYADETDPYNTNDGPAGDYSAADTGVKENLQQNAQVIATDPDVRSASKSLGEARDNLSALEQQQQNARDAHKGLLDAAAEAEKSGNAEEAGLLIKNAEEAEAELAVLDDKISNALNNVSDKEKALSDARQQALDDFYGNKKAVLPSTKKTIADCKAFMNEVHMNTTVAKQKFVDREDEYIQEVLACGIKTGDISLWMVPYYIRFILEFILQLGGLVAVGGIIYGGYLYLFAGISDDKDRGKKAIIYGVGGIILAMTAWALVNIVISVVTA